MNVVAVHPGSSPLILSFPHTGTHVPSDIWDRLNDNGKLLADTDWHIERLYANLLPDATTVRAAFHRYVIDANRDPIGTSLYPGQNTTALIPETDFDGMGIWQEEYTPSSDDIASRLAQFHKPYHLALRREIERVMTIHDICILYDCHSIRSHISFLFDGKLPDFNIGTDSGTTCDRLFESTAVAVTRDAKPFTSVLNGRFKGGWTTRHYGKPLTGVHAIQMELAQSTYLQTESVPFAYDGSKADKLRVHLKTLLMQLETIARQLKSK